MQHGRWARAMCALGGCAVACALVTLASSQARRLRHVEGALRASEGRLRRLWAANIIGVIHSDAAGAIRDANEAALRMIGFSREDLRAGRIRWIDITPPAYRELDERGIAEARERGACTPYEKIYVSKDGRPVPVLIGYALLEGSRDEFICFALDLTLQKRAEAALAEQITKAITDHASAALFMVELTAGRCLFMNPAAEAMTGFSIDEIGDRPLHDFIHHHRADGRPYPAAECDVMRLSGMSQGRVESQEEVYFRKNGEAFPAVCSTRRIDRPGHAPCVLLEVRDVTGAKRAAAERELLLESERAARSEAERASRAKDEFVAVLSHELRTPLNAILGWAELAERPGQGAEQREKALRVVGRNARLMAQIIADLLDVSRISSGKMRVELGPVDLSRAVLAAIDAVRATADAKGVALSSTIDARSAVVSGDAPRLQQIVWNLLTNAIKFTPRGGHVGVSLSEEGDLLRVAVSDDGVGIDPAFLPQLFERFRQADTSTSRSYGGLGLGLSIVKHLVDAHGGAVRAESDGLGRGARFTVELPRAPAHDEVHPDGDMMASCLEALSGARVLVVDDEPDANELVQRLLEERGAVVRTARSGPEALAVLARERVDVMVSDIGMPGMDGYELMRRARAIADGLPAVALTAHTRAHDRARAFDAGYRDHLAKPVEPAKMLLAVALLVMGPRAEA